MRSAALGLAVASVGLLDSGGAPTHVEELTGTPIEANELAKYAERFNNDRPDIQIQLVCYSMQWAEGTMTQHENFARLVPASAERVRYQAGDVILKEGDYGDRMFILTAGRAQITIRNQLLETVEEGDVFGEMALVDAGPRGASVVAETDCEVAPVDVRRFEFMVCETPLFALRLMRVMSRRLRAMNARGLAADGK